MKIKRWLSVLLCMLLCVGMLPTMAFAANEADTWDGTADTSWYDANSTEFHITTAEQLAGLATLVNANTDTFDGKTIYLENDLDLSGHEWISIGNGANVKSKTFAGLFDGQGHCIYNLYSHEDTVSGTSETNCYRSGLFGTLYSATIQNLGIENADISVSDNDTSLNGKGILVDSIYASTIQNCWTTGTISGGSGYDKYIGGLVGCVYGGNTNNIIGCYSSAAITGNYSKDDGYFDSLGGIVGGVYYPTVVISDCWFDGTITVNSTMAATGGIAGYTEGTTVKNCMVSTTDIGTDGENTCWISYSVDIAAENCYWPDGGVAYGSCVYNETAGTPAGKAIQDFNDASVLKELQNNAESGVVWVAGINHPTFSWDEQNIPANYEIVNTAIEKANALNKDEYKDFSAVEAAINAVIWDKSITDQAAVNEMAKAIEDAIAALEYKDADYTKVDKAIAKAEALSPDDYTDFSAVEAAVSAVVRGKDITEQDEVDDMALAIENAIANLEKKPATGTPSDTDTPTGGNQTGDTTAPETGDDSNIALWIAVLLSAGAALTGTVLYSRKRKYSR